MEAHPREDCCRVTPPRTETPSSTPARRDRGDALTLATSAGSVLAAFVASACCVGPLILALLGLGGGALLVAFEPYRPFFIAVTVALLATGFYLSYRGRRAMAAGPSSVGKEACDCPAPRTNRAGRVMLWVATALVGTFMVSPYLIPFILGCC